MKRWMEQVKPLLDSLLIALESLQQRLASKEDAEEGEETSQFNASFGFCDLQNYKTTLAKIGLDLICLSSPFLGSRSKHLQFHLQTSKFSNRFKLEQLFPLISTKNYKTTLAKIGLDLVCLKKKNSENLNTTEYSRLLLYLSNPNHKQAA